MFSSRTQWQLQENEIQLKLAEIKARNETFTNLTESNPTRCGFNYLSNQLLIPLTNQQSLSYDPDPRGAQTARNAVASYYKSMRQIDINPAHIFMTSGTSEAYAHILRLLFNAGDSLLTPKPSYPLLEYLCSLHDVRQECYDLLMNENWRIDFTSVRNRNSNLKAVSVIHPNNPTGSFLSLNDRSELIRYAEEQSLAIISDEVFLDYQLQEDENRSGSMVTNNETLTFTLSGISKILGLPQMKISWIVVTGPDKLVIDACNRLEVIADTFLSVSSPSQLALPDWMSKRREIQGEIITRLRRNYATLAGMTKTNQRIRVPPSAGGWNAIIEIPGTPDDQKFCISLLESKKILIQPGYLFDFSSDSIFVVSLLPQEEHFGRGVQGLLNFVKPS